MCVNQERKALLHASTLKQKHRPNNPLKGCDKGSELCTVVHRIVRRNALVYRYIYMYLGLAPACAI